MPPETPRSRSFTRLTMRVGLPHLGQSVLLVVSITFMRSAVLAILAISSPIVWCDLILAFARVSTAALAVGGWHRSRFLTTKVARNDSTWRGRQLSGG
jgi:hypothetical protein